MSTEMAKWLYVAKCDLGQVNLESMRPATGWPLQGLFPLTGFSWNLPAAPCIFAAAPPIFDDTSSQAHRLK